MTKIRCKKCGDVIYSKDRHDFKECSCKSCSIDGGSVYTRIGYTNIKDIEVIKEEI